MASLYDVLSLARLMYAKTLDRTIKTVAIGDTLLSLQFRLYVIVSTVGHCLSFIRIRTLYLTWFGRFSQHGSITAFRKR